MSTATWKTIPLTVHTGKAVKQSGGWITDHPALTEQIQRGDLTWPNQLLITQVSEMTIVILGQEDETVTRQLDTGPVDIKDGYIPTLLPFYIASQRGATFEYRFKVPA